MFIGDDFPGGAGPDPALQRGDGRRTAGRRLSASQLTYDRRGGWGNPARGPMRPRTPMTTWEYVTVPLLVHATKQILDNWGDDGWELVAVIPGPNPEQLVAYMKRPKE
jgi:hypothetical protein